MNKELIRIGTNTLVNTSTLEAYEGFDLLFGGRHEFVYLSGDGQTGEQLENGTWTGSWAI